MEIHGSSLNLSVSRLNIQRPVTPIESAAKRPGETPLDDSPGRTNNESLDRTTTQHEEASFTGQLEKIDRTLDVRRFNAIKAYTILSETALSERRNRSFFSIDLYV